MPKKSAKKTARKSPARQTKKAAKGKRPPRRPSGKSGGQPNQDFLDALDNEVGESFNESKTRTSTRGFEFTNKELVTGDYLMRVVSCKLKPPKNGKPAAVITSFSCVLGDCIGQGIATYDPVSNEMIEALGRTELDLLCERLQGMGINTQAMESIRELPDACKALTANKPYIVCHIDLTVIPPEESNSGKEYVKQNLYCNELVDDETAQAQIAELHG